MTSADDDLTRAETQTSERIGPYAVEGVLGAGGMGRVVRARDTRLGRSVAIKIAHEQFSARFQREARTIAQLNHPNICTLHDIGPDYLVMECIEGQTLSARIAAGPLPVNEVVDIASQAASGLRAAHERGIVHRDIKPANIMVTAGGIVKVMDFGLARLASGELDVTAPGTMVGTPAYMSPEQATGRGVDRRTDIWSLGVVVYEMLTGRTPFRGDTALAVCRAIVDDKPEPIAKGRPAVPAPLVRLVEKALAKDPEKRYQTADELLADLVALRQSEARVASPHGRPALYTVLAVSIAAMALGAWWLVRDRPMASNTPLRTEQITAFPDSAVAPAISRDGRMLAFIRGSEADAAGGALGQIYLKMLPSGEPVPLTHDTERKLNPVFSPDGSLIGYTVTTPNQRWDAWVVPVIGGQPRLLLPNASGLTWIGDRQLLFSEIKTGMHMAVVTSAEGRANARDVYVPADIRGMAHYAYRAPEGTSVLLIEMDRGSWLPCRVVPFDGSSAGRIVGPPRGKCTSAAWSPDGKWIYVSSDATGTFQLWRQRFPEGQPEQITFGPTQSENIAVAPDGRSLITSLGFGQTSVWIHDRGIDRQLSGEGTAMLPRWGDGMPRSVFSPDGRKVFYFVQKTPQTGFGGGDLWVADLENGSTHEMLPGLGINTVDVSPDGKQIVFAAPDRTTGKSRIWIAPVDRGRPPQVLPPAEGLGPVFGSDNEIYFRGPDGGQWYIFALDVPSRAVRRFSSDPAVNAPTVSPDGHWIVSKTALEGQDDTAIVKAYPKDGGAPLTICRSCFVSWPRDGRTLFFSFRGNSTPGKTWVIELPPGRAFPDLPRDGWNSDADLANVRTITVLDRSIGSPGLTASTYAYEKQFIQRNLFRIWLD
jgi:Tol biopolymer transport system component